MKFLIFSYAKHLTLIGQCKISERTSCQSKIPRDFFGQPIILLTVLSSKAIEVVDIELKKQMCNHCKLKRNSSGSVWKASMDSTSIITQVNKEDEAAEVTHYNQVKRRYSVSSILLICSFDAGTPTKFFVLIESGCCQQPWFCWDQLFQTILRCFLCLRTLIMTAN